MDSSSDHAPKKRRFFKDDLDDVPNVGLAPVSNDGPPTSPISSVPGSPIRPHNLPETSMAFSDKLVAVLDEDLTPHVVRSLEDASGGNLERAVNMYFDGSWDNHVRDVDPATRGLMRTAHGKRPLGPTLNNFIKTLSAPFEGSRKRTLAPTFLGEWTRKYVGSFGVEGWAIGSGTNMLKAGDPLLIERQSPNPPKPKPSQKSNQTTLKLRTVPPPSRFPLSSKQQGKQHMLVRFTTPSGREVGRLPQETANYVSTLIDQNICFFEGVCIFAPDRIRTGDNILIQLRCYFLRKAFQYTPPSHEDRPGIWDVSETEEERALKSRRIALLHLFNAIRLEPIARSTQQFGNTREKLLLAAQLPDPKEKAPEISRSSSQSGSDEEKEVEEDTLNALYRKAQMYDPHMPTTEPPETFKYDLRKYQKQALCWMIGKESGGEKDVRKQQSLHPLWEEYEWPRDDSTPMDKENALMTGEIEEKFYMNPYSGEMSLTLPTYEAITKGGILADGNFPRSKCLL